MNRLCILGIGSPLGDDQAGWLTIDALLASGIQPGQGIVIEKLDRPGANLIARMESAAWVILVDALQSGGQAGQVRKLGPGDWPRHLQYHSSHGFGVIEALALAEALGSLPPRLDVYGIEMASAMPGDGTCDRIQTAARRLAAQIAAEWHDTLRLATLPST